MAKHGAHGDYRFRAGKRFERELLAQACAQSLHFMDKLRAGCSDSNAIRFNDGQPYARKLNFNIHDEPTRENALL